MLTLTLALTFTTVRLLRSLDVLSYLPPQERQLQKPTGRYAFDTHVLLQEANSVRTYTYVSL